MVGAVVGAVLGAVVGSVVKTAADLGVNVVKEKLKQWTEFEVDIGEIKRNLELKLANQEEQLLQEVINPREEQKISLEHLVDLAYDIEDCLDRLQRSKQGWYKLSNKVKELKKRLENTNQGKQNNNGNHSQSTTTSLPPANASSSTSPHQPVKLVGIDEPMKEILEQLDDIEGQQEQTTTKVICIVGFSGTGKSKLAEKVFNCTDLENRFPCRGRVIASQYKDNPDGLLMALIKDISPQATDHVKNITDHLINKRYFIVLDDIIDKEQWFSISTSFPDTTGAVIIVTTKDQTVAVACTDDGNKGFVHNMRSLSKTHSRQYLAASLGKRNKVMFEKGLTLFAKKCDGHPLSLASMTKYLLGKEKFTKEDFHDFWNHLGDKMKSDNVFRKLEQILVDSYRTLDCNNVRAFLLYLCLFPNGHPIRRKRLTRRWSAEGYSAQLDSYLQQLVEKNVVRRVESSKVVKKVKCCRVHGIMHGFMLHMSKPAKFIASASSVNNIDRGKYRHLYFKGGKLEQQDVGSSVNSQDKKNSFRAHSLTICGGGGKKVIGDLPKCKLLRVLDLEECNDLEKDDIKDIHKLWHLKYLSLGATINSLPSKIVKLNHLETLDIRKANIQALPAGVIMLPHLAHLLGKFKLEETKSKNIGVEMLFPLKDKLEKFWLKKSNLQTLAGFITEDNDRGFARLMLHMKKLNKVKIWCKSMDKHSVAFTDHSKAIKNFIQARLDTPEVEQSLSLYLDDSSSDILSSLSNTEDTVSGHLSILKLHGALCNHTQFASLLSGLRELCLSSTNDLTTNELSNLHRLKYLEYLKLVNIRLAEFKITIGHFRMLLRLRLVQCHGSVPTIAAEALPSLVSLWIIDETLDGLSGIKIENHRHLQEVALDSSVKQETITSWDEAAKKHPKRPKVLFFKCVSLNGTMSMVKCVATERPEPPSLRKRKDISAEWNSVEQQLCSDFNKRLKLDDEAKLEEAVAAGRPSPSIDLHGAMDNDVASSSRVIT